MTVTNTIINGANALPLYVLISSLLEGIIFQDNRGLVFFIALCINFVINFILKSILWARNENAKRPSGATDSKCGDKYGNPSGHAQFAWFFAIFWILYILISNTFTNTTANVLSCISLVLIAIIISSGRIIIQCHTLSQVLLGAVIGIIIGIIAFFCTKNILIPNNNRNV